MATKDDTSTPRSPRNPSDPASASASPPPASGAPDQRHATPSRSYSTAHPPAATLEQAIDAERLQLLQAHGVIKCLYEVLLHAEGDDAVTYADTAAVAARLIDESVERLDRVRLKPLIEALKAHASAERADAKPPSSSGPFRVEEGGASSRVFVLR